MPPGKDGRGQDKAPRKRRKKTAAEKAATAKQKKKVNDAKNRSQVNPMSNYFTAANTGEQGGEAAVAVAVAVATVEAEAEVVDEERHNTIDQNNLYPVEAGDDDTPQSLQPEGIDADNSDDEGDSNDITDEDFEVAGSVMATYLEAIQKQIRKEISKRSTGASAQLVRLIIKPILDEHEWWIPQSLARKVCLALDIAFEEPAYYRDVFVWLPDWRWGPEGDPVCPECLSPKHVRPHGFQNNHFARLVYKMSGHYFVMSRRYICTCCAAKLKDAAARAADAHGLKIAPVQKETDIGAGTFMGYDPISRENHPRSYGSDYFPAFFTHRGAVDLSIVDLMRPLYNKSFRPASFSSMMKELATKRHTKEYIKREHDIKAKRAGRPDFKRDVLFSEFGDKMQFAGKYPSGRYLSHVYKRYANTLQQHFSREVKKRDSNQLSWDASYKEPKHLCRFNGKPVFKALITGTNRLGEIRIQFHAVTDGHQQMVNALDGFVDSVSKYGQEPIEFLFTDKPMEDRAFFLEKIPSLAAKQAEYDKRRPVAQPCTVLGASRIVEEDDVIHLTTAREITEHMDALREKMLSVPSAERVFGFDGEWRWGTREEFPPYGKDTMGTAQISYVAGPGKITSLVLYVWDKKKNGLPPGLLSFLNEKSFRYTGVRVKNDIVKLGTDFKCINITNDIVNRGAFVELGSMAVERGVETDGRVGLQKLCMLTLQENLTKKDSIRSSNWSIKQLSREQLQYAALDAIKSLEVFFFLDALTDLSARLSAAEAQPDLLVTLAPPHGKVGSTTALAKKGGEGQILSKAPWEPPNNLHVRRSRKKRKGAVRLIRVDKVFVPNLHVPGLMYFDPERSGKKPRGAVLGDFGPVPFSIEVPLRFLVGRKREALPTTTGQLPDIALVGDANVAVAGAAAGTAASVARKREGGDFVAADDMDACNLGSTSTGAVGVAVRPSRGNVSVVGGLAASLEGGIDSDVAVGVSAGSLACNETSDTNTDRFSTRWKVSPIHEEDGVSGNVDSEHYSLECAADEIEGGTREELTAQEIAEIEHIVKVGAARKLIKESAAVKLDPLPSEIVDLIQVVLGDPFHYQSRPRIPVRHEIKKAYCVALTCAFFEWDPTVLAKAKAALRTVAKKSDDEIAAMLFYNMSYFLEVVPRKIPPPSYLYFRVRAVFATYGPMIDSKTKKPLFNDNAWKKANGVLREILAGHASDPPDASFYTKKVDKNGDLATNLHGLQMYWCSRGTPGTELYHKVLLDSLGTWSTGTEMSDCLRNEHRHRYNHNIAEAKRLGFPRLGHFDTWLMDLIQILVYENHRVVVCPGWSNTNDCLDTPESFGTIALQSSELTERVNDKGVELEEAAKLARLAKDGSHKAPRQTAEQRYLAQRQGVSIAFTPVSTAEEKTVFTNLLLGMGGFDDAEMALKWVDKVDGVHVFPKTPVYLRTYHEEWIRKRRMKDAVARAKSITEPLARLNDLLSINAHTEPSNLLLSAAADLRREEVVGTDDTLDTEGAEQADESCHPLWPEPNEPFRFKVSAVSILPRPGRIVAGTLCSSSGTYSRPQKKARGERGRDSKQRASRQCKRCIFFGGMYSACCKGRTKLGKRGCEYFNEDGDSVQTDHMRWGHTSLCRALGDLK